MASKAQAIFVSFNIFFFAVTTATQYPAAIPGFLTTAGGNVGTGGGNGGGGAGECPRDVLKLGVCLNLLGGLVGVEVGSPPTLPCCTLLAGLTDLEVAACLCTAIRADALGINLNIPVDLSLIFNDCGREVPNGFTC
ncbi:14 kDa proline-rich protein DC2.15-like [Ipomoea triloba]|uniref:14 kDa proline-rich protein DC2.15-like n=1 Tax=Ipomoea triloba TaxID=35885 RepID=UPI00125DB1BC|nr:14 kDa proline-rich protein DC2.15-like [Ipomoea triloba]